MTQIVFVPKNVWRTAWVLVAVVALVLLAHFVIDDGGSVIFALTISWFLSLAMEPAVARLARHMKRGIATALVMLTAVAFIVAFLFLFGQLFITQVAALVADVPSLFDSAIGWVNDRLDTSYSATDILNSLNLSTTQVSSYVTTILGGALTIFSSLAGALFQAFSVILLTFYLSADGPRLRRWVARLLPEKGQRNFVEVWDLTLSKTGGYVGARVLLALVNGVTSVIVFVLVGLPSWLALAIWTGLVAQFVPTIGTYISIILPVLVGLLSDRPWTGLAVLAWAVVYQQVENLTIEPRISARAVNVHPAVSFSAVLLGTALFGAAGALLSIPVAAMLLALAQERLKTHELLPDLFPAEAIPPPDDSSDDPPSDDPPNSSQS